MGLTIFGSSNFTQLRWVPEPEGRGTYSLLSTCILTLGLCVYTSIHLNIPEHNASRIKIFLRRTKWVLIALLAPEFVVYNAWWQRNHAKEILRKLRVHHRINLGDSSWKKVKKSLARLRSPKDPESQDKKEDRKKGILTLVHAFFIDMGGVVLDMTNDPERVWPVGFNRVTLSAEGYFYLLWHGYADVLPNFLHISEKAITDKSKANGLAKAIVCVQATWFCVQFVARLAEGLPISLLELSTFAHALCAFLIYLCWWEKPLDIEEPLLVPTQNSEKLRRLCANIWVQSSLGQMPRLRGLGIEWHFRERGNKLVTKTQRIAFGEGAIPLRLINEEPHQLLSDPPFHGLGPGVDGLLFTNDNPPLLLLKPGDRIPGTSFAISPKAPPVGLDAIILARLQRVRTDWTIEELYELTDSTAAVPRGEDVEESNLANTSTYHFQHFARYQCLHRSSNIAILLRSTSTYRPENCEITRLGDKRNAQSIPSFHSLTYAQILGLTLSGILYGGLHALAWGSHTLRSRAENVLWIASCVVVMGGGVTLVLLYADVGNSPNDVRIFRLDQRLWRLRIIPSGLRVLVWIVYVCARVFLLVEVFLAVPFVDEGVYGDVSWPNYWPHIN